jgi:hypothetical protein
LTLTAVPDVTLDSFFGLSTGMSWHVRACGELVGVKSPGWIRLE